MISGFTILYLLLIHWVGDFLFQSVYMAENKSKSFKVLISHTALYSGIITVCLIFLLELTMTDVGIFGLVTFVTHTAIDYVTSKIISKKFANKEYGTSIPNTGAFTVIGIDQTLHYTQLFLTYIILVHG